MNFSEDSYWKTAIKSPEKVAYFSGKTEKFESCYNEMPLYHQAVISFLNNKRERKLSSKFPTAKNIYSPLRISVFN